MRVHADANDANRAILLGVTAAVTSVILITVGAELLQGHNPPGIVIGLIVATLICAWLFSNFVYALHYAHMFYLTDKRHGKDTGGVDIPGTSEPDYWDFIYFSFTLGMTFQTSDTAITSGRYRRVVTMHCLAAFVFVGLAEIDSHAMLEQTETCARETMPPYAERKMRLAATMPRNSICVRSVPTQ